MRRARYLERRGAPLAAALAAAAPMLLLALPAIRGETYLAGDLAHLHLPFRRFYAACLAAGDRFDWSPEVWCGFDLLGEGQAGLYHPLHLLLYRLLPLDLAFDAEVLLPFPLALLGAGLLLRRRSLPWEASLLGGISFAFGSFFLSQVVHPGILTPLAHLPWNLLAIEALAGGRKGTLAGAGLAALTASQALYGHPQALVFSGLFEVAWLLAVSPGGWRLRRVGPYLLAKALGVAAAGIQVLPTIAAYSRSARAAAGTEYLGAFALRPRDLLHLVGPYLFEGRAPDPLFPQESSGYLGAFLPSLLVWAAIAGRRLGAQRRFVAALLGTAFVSLLLAFGPHGFLEPALRRVPVVAGFRAAGRIRALFQLSLALVAAVAFADLIRASRDRPMPWRAIWPVFAPAVAAAGVAAAALIDREGTGSAMGAALSAPGSIALGPVIFLGAALLVALAGRGRRLAAAAIPLVAAADLAAFGIVRSPALRAGRLEAWVASVPVPPPGDRVVVRGGNELLMRGYRQADGYVGLPPVLRLDWSRPAAHRVAGVRWIRRHRADPPDFADRFLPASAGWYEVAGPLPRARLLSRAAASDRPAETLERIDVEREAVVERPLDLDGGPPGRASIATDRPGVLRLEVEAPAPRLLAVSERFDPGWTARVGAEAARVERVNGEFLGCLVPAGRSEVFLEYRSVARRVGGVLSLAGGASILLLAGWGARSLRARRQTPQSSRKLQRPQLEG